jgi:NADH-quinone oxidoreductase subunit G
MAGTLAQIAAALSDAKGGVRSAALAAVKPAEEATLIAGNLAQGKDVGIFLGNFAVQHPDYAVLHTLAREIATLSGGRFGILGDAANSVGGHIAGALPPATGNARAMFERPRQAYLLLNVEPELDCANPAQALSALSQASLVVAMSPYSIARATTHVLLPIAVHRDHGTFINCEGRPQSFSGVVARREPPESAARARQPARDFRLSSTRGSGSRYGARRRRWRETRVDADFAFLPVRPTLHRLTASSIKKSIYHSDSLVRRSPPLQQTNDAPAARR